MARNCTREPLRRLDEASADARPVQARVPGDGPRHLTERLYIERSETAQGRDYSVSVTPGPCPPTGCPAPTEIDCILVDKVFDYCFQADTSGTICTPFVCTGTVTGISCAVTGATCSFQSSTPAATTDFINATFLISATVDFTITTTVTTCTASTSVTLLKTVTLCGPAGTVQSCTVLSGSCAPPAIVDGTVCTTVTICTTFTSTAPVQLLVPAYGYCSPAPCVTQPLPPCPPSPLFPPQCT